MCSTINQLHFLIVLFWLFVQGQDAHATLMRANGRVLFICEFTITILSIISEHLLLSLSREGWQWSSVLFCPAGQNNASGNEQPDPQFLRRGTPKTSAFLHHYFCQKTDYKSILKVRG